MKFLSITQQIKKMCQMLANEDLVWLCEKFHQNGGTTYDAAFETLRERGYFMEMASGPV